MKGLSRFNIEPDRSPARRIMSKMSPGLKVRKVYRDDSSEESKKKESFSSSDESDNSHSPQAMDRRYIKKSGMMQSLVLKPTMTKQKSRMFVKADFKKTAG